MEEVKREYKMTDAELMMFVSNLVHSMLRDTAEFDDYGVDAADITAFSSLGDSFEVFMPDTYYQAEVGIAAETKDAAREQLITDTRKISNRALAKWDENSPHYKKFGVKGLTDNSDKSLLATARLVAQTAAGYLAELASEGLTQQIIDDYSLLAQQFENDMNAMYNAVEMRDSKTSERILLGNNLYSYVVKYCRFGKTIWDKVDEAKYNDYIIYHTPQELPGKVQNLSFDHLAAAFSWDASPHSETYNLVFRAQGSSGDWAEVYSGPNTSAPYSFDDGDWEIRCRGINSEGKGPWSDLLNITVGLPIPQNVTTYLGPSPDTLVYVNWDGPIPGASRVNVYKSIVPIGDPPGAYIVAGEWSQAPPYYEASTPGVRYYFYCTAYAHYYESPPSEVVFVDS